jgi:hypothetical protein
MVSKHVKNVTTEDLCEQMYDDKELLYSAAIKKRPICIKTKECTPAVGSK